jgi:hypothetical protein
MVAAQTISLVLNHEGATLVALRDQLIQLRQVVSQLPTMICWPDDFGAVASHMKLRMAIQPQWPESGFYDAASLLMEIQEDTSDVGDDLPDLIDLVKDLSAVIHLAQMDEAGSLSWLRFTADSHWGDHVDDLVRHLNAIVAGGADRKG